MPDRLEKAIEAAEEAAGADPWLLMTPREQSAAIYHQLCRLDTGCKRTGTAADMLLPPCAASAGFVARRNCAYAGIAGRRVPGRQG